MGKIIEIADIQVFRKCCPKPCYYCKYIIDLCGWSKSSDISSDDENIRA